MRKDSILANYYYKRLPKAEDGLEYKGHSIVDFLATKGYSGKKAFRKELAQKYGIEGYDFSAKKNIELLNKIKESEDVLREYQPSFAPISVEEMEEKERIRKERKEQEAEARRIRRRQQEQEEERRRKEETPKTLPNKKTGPSGGYVVGRNAQGREVYMMPPNMRAQVFASPVQKPASQTTVSKVGTPLVYALPPQQQQGLGLFPWQRQQIQAPLPPPPSTRKVVSPTTKKQVSAPKQGVPLVYAPTPQQKTLPIFPWQGRQVQTPPSSTPVSSPVSSSTPVYAPQSRIVPSVENLYSQFHINPKTGQYTLLPGFMAAQTTEQTSRQAPVEEPGFWENAYDVFADAVGKSMLTSPVFGAGFTPEGAIAMTKDVNKFISETSAVPYLLKGVGKVKELYNEYEPLIQQVSSDPKGAYRALKSGWERRIEKDEDEKQENIKVVNQPTIKAKAVSNIANDIPEPEMGYIDLGSRPDRKGELAEFTNTFDNDQGARYYIGHKAKEITDAGAKRRFGNSRAVAHFLRDSDILPGQKITPSSWSTIRGYKYSTTSPGKTVSATGLDQPDRYRMLYKPNPKGDGTYLVKYLRNFEITPDKAKQLSSEGWGLDFTVNGFYPFSHIDWEGEGVKGYGKGKFVGIKKQFRKPGAYEQTYLPYKGTKDAYSRFSGGSVTYLFKHPKTGKSIGVDVAGSISTIKKAGEDLIKTYKLNPNDLDLIHHDTGSYSAKPKAKRGVLDYDQWLDYNDYNMGFSGAPLIIPEKKWGGEPNQYFYNKGYGVPQFANGGQSKKQNGPCPKDMEWSEALQQCVFKDTKSKAYIDAYEDGAVGYYDDNGVFIDQHVNLPEIVAYPRNFFDEDTQKFYDNLSKTDKYIYDKLGKKYGYPKVRYSTSSGPFGIYEGTVGHFNPLTNTTTINKEEPGYGDIDAYIDELSHKVDFDKTGKFDRYGKWVTHDMIDYLTGDSPYDNESSVEYNVHENIEPVLRDEAYKYRNEFILNNPSSRYDYIRPSYYLEKYSSPPKRKNGGDISLPNVYPNQMVPKIEYGGPLVEYYKGKMTGPSIFQDGGEPCPKDHVRLNGVCVSIYSDVYKKAYAEGLVGFGAASNPQYATESRIKNLPKLTVVSKRRDYKSLKRDQDWFDNHANWSQTYDEKGNRNEKWDEYVRKMVLTGRFGVNPKTGELIKLPQSEWTNVPEEYKEMASADWGKTSIPDRLASKTAAGKRFRKNVVAESMKDVFRNPITYAPGAIFFGGLAAPAVTGALGATGAALNAPILGTVGTEYGLGALTTGNLLNLAGGMYGANQLANPNSMTRQAISQAYDNPTALNIANAAALGGLDLAGVFTSPGMGGLMRSTAALPNYLKNAYNTVATGESVLPVAWKSSAVNLSQSASDDMFRTLLNSDKLSDADRALIVEYQHQSSPFTGRFGNVNQEKRDALNNIIKKYNLNVGNNVIATRRFNPTNQSLGATLEGNRLNFGDRPTSFSAGVGTEGYGSGAVNRIVIPNRYLKGMGDRFIANQYTPLSEDALKLLEQSGARNFGSAIGTSNQSINAERELIGTGLDFRRIGTVKNDIGGYDWIVKPRSSKPTFSFNNRSGVATSAATNEPQVVSRIVRGPVDPWPPEFIARQKAINPNFDPEKAIYSTKGDYTSYVPPEDLNYKVTTYGPPEKTPEQIALSQRIKERNEKIKQEFFKNKGKQKYGGSTGYKKGEEYELSDAEIKELIKKGYKIKYV